MIEKETKYRAPNLTDIQILMRAIQSKFGGIITEENQLDEYFDTPDLFLTNLRRGVRLRNKSKLEFKSLFFNGERYLVDEIEIKDDNELEKLLSLRFGLKEYDNNKTISIFKRFGLSPEQIIDKFRMNLKLEKLILSIDKVKGLPVYIEIEGDNDELLNSLETFIQTLTTLEPAGTRGYVNLLYENDPRMISKEDFAKRFDEKPDWNVLDTERELVKSLFAE